MHDNMEDSDGGDGNDSVDESQDNDFPGYKSIIYKYVS
jgi:hypothetical protein